MAKRTLKSAERRLAWLLLMPAFAAVALLVAWPIYVVVQMSIRPTRQLALDQLMSQPLGWGNFDRVLHQSTTWAAFLNSGIYTIGTLIPAFLFGLLVALLFNRLFPARRCPRPRGGSAARTAFRGVRPGPRAPWQAAGRASPPE